SRPMLPSPGLGRDPGRIASRRFVPRGGDVNASPCARRGSNGSVVALSPTASTCPNGICQDYLVANLTAAAYDKRFNSPLFARGRWCILRASRTKVLRD